jgi:transposase
MSRGDLTDEQWSTLQPLLPTPAREGRPRTDDRRILDGILWILRTGAPWRDLPERYGKPGTVSSRFYRWRQAGIWQCLWTQVQQQGHAAGQVDWDIHFVDSTVIRAHQHAAGSKKKMRQPKP